MTYRLAALGFLVSAFLTSSRSSPSAESRERKTVVISISKFAFAPGELTLAPGDSIEWSNDDLFRHTTTADSGAWSSPELRRGERFVFVPTDSGRFSYHCALHPVMSGTIVVRP
jgi:plastocyanin